MPLIWQNKSYKPQKITGVYFGWEAYGGNTTHSGLMIYLLLQAGRGVLVRPLLNWGQVESVRAVRMHAMYLLQVCLVTPMRRLLVGPFELILLHASGYSIIQGARLD